MRFGPVCSGGTTSAFITATVKPWRLTESSIRP